MTKTEFNRVVLVAKSGVDLSGYDFDALFGCGLPGFEPVMITLGAAARHVRWQCLGIFGNWWDDKEMNECWRIFRWKVRLVGEGSDDAAALPGRLLAQALGLLSKGA